MSEMLGHETHSNGTSAPTGKKADKRKQTIIAIAAVVGVLLTYLLWRRSTSQAASSGATDYAQPSGVAGDGGSAGTGADYSGAFNAIGSQLTTMQGQMQSQQSQYDNLEEEFNSKIQSLTATQRAQGAQIHHQAGVIHDTTQAQGQQIHHIASVVHAHEAANKHVHHAAAHHNTHKTKKKA